MTKFDFNNPIKWIAEQKNEKVSYFYFLIEEKEKEQVEYFSREISVVCDFWLIIKDDRVSVISERTTFFIVVPGK